MGKCAGLPIDLKDMPTEVVSMARLACTEGVARPSCDFKIMVREEAQA